VVTWEWYDKSQGIIKWTFTNTGKAQESVILLRNGYYFGGAFWPVYVANPEFGVTWMTEVKPLVDNGAENNAPPIAPVTFSNGYTQVLFVFTLSGGQTWSMLEGGLIILCLNPRACTRWMTQCSRRGASVTTRNALKTGTNKQKQI